MSKRNKQCSQMRKLKQPIKHKKTVNITSTQGNREQNNCFFTHQSGKPLNALVRHWGDRYSSLQVGVKTDKTMLESNMGS